MSDDDMCPNCVTPWKCNWPPISGDVHKTHYADDDTLAYIAKLEEEIARLKGFAEGMRDWIMSQEWTTSEPIKLCNDYRAACPKEGK